MIFLPFGLHAKIYRIPYATISIVLLSLYFSTVSIMTYSGFQIESSNYLQIIQKFFVFNNRLLLITSVFLLLAFSIYVELRIGSLLYVLTYFIGGAFAFLLKTYAFKSEPILYSLTALSTLLGAYLVLLGKKNYRAYVYIPPRTKKTIYFPSALFLMASQIFVIASHIVFHKDFPLMSLTGLPIGALLGLIWAQVLFVQDDFLFPIEVTYLLKAKKQFDPLKKIDLIIDCLQVNPSNSQAMEYLFRSIAKAKVAPHFFTEKQKKILASIISGILKKEIVVDLNLTIYFLSLLPMNWDLKDLGLHHFDDRDLSSIDELVEQSQWKLALRLYDVHLMTEANPANRATTQKKANGLLDNAIRAGLSSSEKEWIAQYIHHHPNNPIAALIRPRIKHKEKKLQA